MYHDRSLALRFPQLADEIAPEGAPLGHIHQPITGYMPMSEGMDLGPYMIGDENDAPAEDGELDLAEFSVAPAMSASVEPRTDIAWQMDPNARLSEFGEVAQDDQEPIQPAEIQTPGIETQEAIAETIKMPESVAAPIIEEKQELGVEDFIGETRMTLKRPRASTRGLPWRKRAAYEIGRDVREAIRSPLTYVLSSALAVAACTTVNWHELPNISMPFASAPQADKSGIIREENGGVKIVAPKTCSEGEPMYVVGEHNVVKIDNNNICARLIQTAPTMDKAIEYTGIRLSANANGTFNYQRLRADGTPDGKPMIINPEVMRSMQTSWALSNDPQSWPFKLKLTALESGFDPNSLNDYSGASSVEQITYDTYVYFIWNYGDKLGLADRQEQMKKVQARIGGNLDYARLAAQSEIKRMFRQDRFDAEISGLIGEANRQFLRMNAQSEMLDNGYTFADGRTAPNEREMYLSHNQAKTAKTVFKAFQDGPDQPISKFIQRGTPEYEQNWPLFESRVYKTHPKTGKVLKDRRGKPQIASYRVFTVREAYENLQTKYGFTNRGMRNSFIVAGIPAKNFQMPLITDLTGTFALNSTPGSSFWARPLPNQPWILQEFKGLSVKRVASLESLADDAEILRPAAYAGEPIMNRVTTAGEYRKSLKAQQPELAPAA